MIGRAGGTIRALAIATAASGAMIAGASAADLVIGTAAKAGAYYPYGEALAKAWTGAFPDAAPSVIESEGSADNIRQLAAGTQQVGMVEASEAIPAIAGEGNFGGPQPVVALFGAYPSMLHVVARADSGIKSLKDLAGKRVNIGPEHSETAEMALDAIEAAGLKQADLQVQQLKSRDAAEALAAGTLDASFAIAATGNPVLSELAGKTPLTFVPLSAEEVAAATPRNPAYVAGELPGGSYAGQSAAVPGIAVWNLVLVNRSMSDDEAYALTKAAFEHGADLGKAAPAGAAPSVESTVRDLALPIHPGAARYFAEQGHPVPAERIAK